MTKKDKQIAEHLKAARQHAAASQSHYEAAIALLKGEA